MPPEVDAMPSKRAKRVIWVATQNVKPRDLELFTATNGVTLGHFTTIMELFQTNV